MTRLHFHHQEIVSRSQGEFDARGKGLPTWVWFCGLATAYLLLALILNQFILTETLYEHLFAGRMDEATWDDFMAMLRRGALVGYATLPFFLLVRVAFFALLVQGVLLVLGTEVRLGALFRTLTQAHFFPLAGAVAQWMLVSTTDPTLLTRADLTRIPGSLAELAATGPDPTWATTLLAQVNAAEFAFVALITYRLVHDLKVSAGEAVFATGAVWSTLVVAKGSLMYITTMMSGI